MEDFAILVNTCDTFDDCWDAFFRLWTEYGLPQNLTIYLNTEYKDYSYSGLKIIPLKVCSHVSTKDKRPTWSWCLYRALEAIPENTILYLQEDYFLHAPINQSLFFEYLDFFKQSRADYLSVATTPSQCYIDTRFGTEKLPIWKVRSNYTYLVSCQAALWKKTSLMNLISIHETGWMFERWASRRARISNYLMLTMDSSDPHRIVPYIPTGIVKGKWYMPACQVFENHDIQIDYSKRGIYCGREYPKTVGQVFPFLKLAFIFIWRTYVSPRSWVSVLASWVQSKNGDKRHI